MLELLKSVSYMYTRIMELLKRGHDTLRLHDIVCGRFIFKLQNICNLGLREIPISRGSMHVFML